MAPRPARPKKQSLKAARANARGFAARQARKAVAGDGLDVYEYSTGRVRRSGVALSLDREEEDGISKKRDDDDEDDIDDVREKLRLRIANGDEEGVVLSDEDEEIDSDGAFDDESDEERFANFKFRESSSKSSKSKGRGREKAGKAQKPAASVSFAADVDLNEDEDEDDGGRTPRPAPSDSDEDEEADEDEEDEEEDAEPGSMMDLSTMLEQGAQSDPESESDAESESGSEASSATSSDPDASSKLASFISGLDTSSKKRKQEDSAAERANKKRLLVQDKTEAGPEGEFGARSGPQPLTLSDLLAPAPSLSQSTKALQSTTKSALSAPLAQRTQDRLDREAAYAATKEEIQKWAPTMKRIKDAEHLAFPLQGPRAGKGAGTSNADVVGRFQPTTPLESAISTLLRAAHLHTDAATAEAENTLIPATISPDDLASRRAQLRATRELMFRADVKAKRVAKIKSKSFRRMKKREREKQGEAAVELGLDEVDEEEERIKAETLRAKERATLRHRTTGKWAQAMRRKGEMGDEEMEGVQSLVDRSEVLRRKIAGESESSDDEDRHGEERDIQELEELGRVGDDVKGKGIMGMKFMREAIARAEREAGGMADEVRLEMLGLERDDAEGMGDEIVGGNVGRRVYKPGQVKPLHEFSDVSSTLKSSESNDSPTDTLTPLPTVPNSNTPSQSPPSNTTPIPIPNPWTATTTSVTDTNMSNPWLTAASNPTGKLSRKANIVQTTKMQKVQSKNEAERAKAREEAVVELDMTQAMVVPEKSKLKQGGAKEKGTVEVDAAYAPSDDEGSETDEKGPTAFKQRELVAMAFAGDNVIEDFSVEKQRVIDEDAPKEVDTTLAGWGSWGGRGTKKAAPRPNLIKKIAGVDASKRPDAGRAHVIISEKKDKKASKYLIKDLPYPYTSREQFARSMATPVGTEWNTRVAHQRATLPRVVKKMGTVIDPLEKLF